MAETRSEPAEHRGAALVTGASSGIGKELSRICAAAGRDLVLVARREEVLRELAEELTGKHGIRCDVLPIDLSEPDASTRVLNEVKNRGISVEILINNAGFGLRGPFSETSLDQEMAMIRVNIEALVALTKGILPGMREKKRGRILNVASTAAFQPGPLMAVYYASKAFVLSFTEAIAVELKGSGITVTALCPGPTRSEFQQVAGVTETRLVRMRKIPDAAVVARFGYKAMMNGKRVAIEGTLNRFVTIAIRFLPRNWVAAAVKRLHAA